MAEDVGDLVYQFNRFQDFLSDPSGGSQVILVKIVLSILAFI